jgi:hypothetical protein
MIHYHAVRHEKSREKFPGFESKPKIQPVNGDGHGDAFPYHLLFLHLRLPRR